MGDSKPKKSSSADGKDDDHDDDDDNKSDTKDSSIKEKNKTVDNKDVETGTSHGVVAPRQVSSPVDMSRNNARRHSSLMRRIRRASSIFKQREVYLTFSSQNQPRQPFTSQFPSQSGRNGGQERPPNPPSYYTQGVSPEHHRPDSLRNQVHRDQSRERNAQTLQTTQPISHQPVMSSNMPQFQSAGIPVMNNPFFFNYTYWAPYPDQVPAGVLPCLAHLYQADSLFIIQQLNLFDLFYMGYVDAPNFYLIQNKEGRVIYYVYETANPCLNTCCGSARGFQLHVMDMYNNEIIYMNRPCGCTGYPCCFPVMEVYSPPLVPVGAVMQVFNTSKNEFAIIDADENLLFRIYGPLCFNMCCCCLEVDFTIHALDKYETEVGVIRREWGGYVRTFLAESDMYGITFPVDLDVRIKAVFLGALFFIEYMFFGD